METDDGGQALLALLAVVRVLRLSAMPALYNMVPRWGCQRTASRAKLKTVSDAEGYREVISTGEVL